MPCGQRRPPPKTPRPPTGSPPPSPRAPIQELLHCPLAFAGVHLLKVMPEHSRVAYLFCKEVDGDLNQCILYDGTGPDANLINSPGPANEVQLFNGKDLDGWVAEGVKEFVQDGRTLPGWSVKDGCLDCTDKGFLWYDRRTFADFVFHVETRMAPGATAVWASGRARSIQIGRGRLGLREGLVRKHHHGGERVRL